MGFRQDFRDLEAPDIVHDLGELAQITPVGGGLAVEVLVRFEEGPAEQPPGGFGEVAVESAAPSIEFRSADYPTPSHGDTVSVDGRNFKIVGVDVDNVFTLCQLERV